MAGGDGNGLGASGQRLTALGYAGLVEEPVHVRDCTGDVVTLAEVGAEVEQQGRIVDLLVVEATPGEFALPAE